MNKGRQDNWKRPRDRRVIDEYLKQEEIKKRIRVNEEVEKLILKL